jgi:uncharacterized repeat protein (TIGR01451 family)
MKWFLGALLLLLAALALESGLLAYAMYVLLGLLILSRLLTLSWIGNLDASRHCDAVEVTAGDTITILIVVNNDGALPVPWVLLEDMLPAKTDIVTARRLRVLGRRLKLALIGPRSYASMDYRIKFKYRGYYQIGPLMLETGDFFGLHRRYRVGTDPHFVLVYPRIVPLQGYELSSRRPIGEIRMAHRLYEDPTRLAGVREYQAGDSLNRIHWRATARTGTLHSKVYEPSSVAGATIVLDFHEDGYPRRREPTRSELAVTTAASMAYALYQLGQQIGMITNGRDAADRVRQEGWEHDFRSRQAALRSTQKSAENERLRPVIVPTRRGVEQFQQIWAALARAELSDGLALPQLMTEASSRLPRDATVIVVMPGADEVTALALGNLRRRGYAVTAILVMLEEEDLYVTQARLVAQGLEVRHVTNRRTVAAVCQQQTLR